MARSIASALLRVLAAQHWQAKHMFVDAIRSLPIYGYQWFKVIWSKEAHLSPDNLDARRFGIGLQGIMVLNSSTLVRHPHIEGQTKVLRLHPGEKHR